MGKTPDKFGSPLRLILHFFLSYIIFILVVGIIVFIMGISYDPGPDIDIAKDTVAYVVLYDIFILSFIFFAPVNTIVILLLYIFNINKFLLQNLWYVFIETLCYLFSLIFLGNLSILEFLIKFIPDSDLYVFLFAPYIIIIPIFAVQGYYIKRKRRRKEQAGTVAAINPDDAPQTKQNDKK